MKNPHLGLAALLLALALPTLGSQESPQLEQDLSDGLAALARNDLRAAESAFQEALSQSEDQPQAWLGLSEVERRRANLKGALDSARRAQELAPEIGATAFAVGRVLAELGTYKEAIAALSEARRVAPDEVDAYVLEAFLLRESGQEGDALAVLMEAWDRGSRSELLAEQLSLLLLSAGRASAALKIAEDALQEQPNSVPVRFAKGMALVAIPERRSEAAPLLEEVLAAGTHQEGRARLELGGLLLEERRPTAALPHFEAAALQMPDLPKAFYGLSAALRGVGDEVGARRAMERFEQLSIEADNADLEGKQLGIALNEAQLLAGQSDLPTARARLAMCARRGAYPARVSYEFLSAVWRRTTPARAIGRAEQPPRSYRLTEVDFRLLEPQTQP